MKELPAGFIDLGTVAMHVAKIREYTTDIERFKKYLPLVLELDGVEADKDAWTIYEKADDIEALALTMEEMANLQMADAENLKEIIRKRQREEA